MQQPSIHRPSTTNSIAVQVISLDYDPHPDAWPDLILLCQQVQARTAVITNGANWHIHHAQQDDNPKTHGEPISLLHAPIHQAAIRLLDIWPGRP